MAISTTTGNKKRVFILHIPILTSALYVFKISMDNLLVRYTLKIILGWPQPRAENG
jgi:hypothetical protein